MVAYQCLTGHPPFSGEPLVVALAHLDQGMPALPPSVPPGVAALVAELTRQDPAARPPSAWDVALQAEHLRVLLSSPQALSRHGTAAAPLSVPGAEGALLAGGALSGTGAAEAASVPPPPAWSPAAPPAWSPPAPPVRPRPRRARSGTSLPARGALAATGVAAIGFIAWTLATLPAPARDQLPDVGRPAATTSAAPDGLSRQSQVAATRGDGPNGGNAAVAQAAATSQPSTPARSSPASQAPSSTPGTPSDSPSPGSPTPTPTPSTPTPSSPTPTPSTPTPSSPPTTSVPSTPAPSTPIGTLTPSSVPAPSTLVTVSPGFSVALGA